MPVPEQFHLPEKELHGNSMPHNARSLASDGIDMTMLWQGHGHGIVSPSSAQTFNAGEQHYAEYF